jgi:hypothetical protein
VKVFEGPAPVNSQEVCATAKPVKNQGVCAPSITNNLVQRQIEREEREVRGEEGNATHTPQKLTASPASSIDETHA